MPLVAGRQPDGKRLLTPKSSDILKDFSVSNQKTTMRVLVLILGLSIKNKRLFINVTAVTDVDDVLYTQPSNSTIVSL